MTMMTQKLTHIHTYTHINGIIMLSAITLNYMTSDMLPSAVDNNAIIMA